MSTGNRYLIKSFTLPQASPSKAIVFTFVAYSLTYGSKFHIGLHMHPGKPGGWTVQFRIPAWIRGLPYRASRAGFIARLILKSLDPRPQYVGWRCYYHVDHFETWGSKRFGSGYSAARWAWKQECDEGDGEASFGWWWSDAEDYRQYEEAKLAEKETGYRHLSRDHQLEHFENYGW